MTETATEDLRETGQARTEPQWWQSAFRMFQTNLRAADAAMDVEAALDYIEGHGANVWLVNGGGILSFYPSDLPFQTCNPFLEERASGDLLGDAVAAGRRRAIRVMARMDFSKVGEAVASEHPDWLFVDPRGERQVYNGLTSVCPNGGYYQRAAFEVISEVIDRYGVDGFFFNWFSFNERDYSNRYRGVCHCESCTSLFADQTGGLPLPDGPDHPHYDRWLAFTAAALRDLTSRFRAHVAERAPQAGLILGGAADIMFHEGNNAFGRDLWPHATGDAVSALKSHRPDVPVLVNAVSFVDMPYRLASEQPEHFAQYLIQAISRGANPSTYIMGSPGDVKYAMLDVAAEITRFHRDHEVLYDGLRQSGRIGLVRPERLLLDARAYAAATEEFRGIHLALQETQQPLDVIAQSDLAQIDTDGRLSAFDALVLPDLGELHDEAVAAVDRYILGGGTAIFTGSAGVCADGTVQGAASPGTRRIGRITDPERLRNSYVGSVAPGEDVSVRQSVPMVPVLGELGLFEWAANAEKRGGYVSQAPFGPPEKTFGHALTEHPAWTRRAVGAGLSVRVPWTIGRSYRESSLQVVRDVLTDIVRSDVRPGRIAVDAPEQVTVVMGRSGEHDVVHLLNLSGLRRRGFGPPVPISGMRLIGDSVRRVSALVAGVELTAVGGRVELPELGRFEVLVVENEGENK